MKFLTIVESDSQLKTAAQISSHLKASGCGITEKTVYIETPKNGPLNGDGAKGGDILAPDYTLRVDTERDGKQTAQMMELLEGALIKETADLVVTYGGSNSALTGALVAAKLQTLVAHVGAGERDGGGDISNNVNTAVADKLSTILLCHDDMAVSNLSGEGIVDCGLISDKGVDGKPQTRLKNNEGLHYYIVKNVGDGDFCKNIAVVLSETAKWL